MVDNGSLHRNAVVEATLPVLSAREICLYYLPPHSPELDNVAPVFRNVKHHGVPERRHASITALQAAVDHAFTKPEARIVAKRQYQPG